MTPKPTPLYKHRVLADFGPRQQQFLLKALNEGVELDDELATRKRTEPLERAGLIQQRISKKGRTRWRVTDLGRSIVTGHVPVFLHRRGFPSYTHQAHQAMFAEPEVNDDVDMGRDARPRERPKREETLREAIAAMKARNHDRYAA